MTAKDINRAPERGRSRRRTAPKRYVANRHLNRVSSIDYRIGSITESERERSISILSVLSIAILGIGLFFVIF